VNNFNIFSLISLLFIIEADPVSAHAISVQACSEGGELPDKQVRSI